ncbi:hypothetical protein PV08_10814 [Exophiala spinifera]|uniref:BTB domain-containing protein n=1 Tax=Exophiala spinifera TaxID=91928 RepID=A0A0D2AXX2_9EURO|nr:uncharacterized protein PV08_10814 [Exophiala spinifera]KIW11513.1 hypothetical protein PV08_10814 [Exophiala spinifera]
METPFPYESFLSSPPFRFAVGPDKKVFYVHSALVAKHSDTLAALITNGMRESEQGLAVFDDIDEDTFLHFLEFAYTGEYTVPPPEVIPEPVKDIPDKPDESPPAEEFTESSPEDPQPDPADELIEVPAPESADYPEAEPEPVPAEDIWNGHDWGWGHAKKKKEKSKKKWFDDPSPEVPEDQHAQVQTRNKAKIRSDLWLEFEASAHVKKITPWSPYVNVEPCEDCSVVFLCHAKLYVFSDRYTIPPLRDLVLQKLRLTLSRYNLFESRTEDVVQLVGYTYRNTMDMSPEMDKLREVVMDYLVCHVETIAKDKKFLKLLEGLGALARDLVLKLLPRLNYD